MTAMPPNAQIIHATSVAHSGQALLIRGPSGSGKSSLALQMISLGAGLVADDRTALWRKGENLWAGCPETIEGLIEARGIGILRAPVSPPCPIVAVLDINAPETTDRLQITQDVELFGVTLPLYRPSSAAHFPAALNLLLSHGRHG